MPVTVQQILNMKCMQITGNGRRNQPKFAWKNFVKSQIKQTFLTKVSTIDKIRNQ